MIHYKESLNRMRQKIDWLGAATLLIAILSLMFALEMGGSQYAWGSGIIISLFTSFVFFFGLFCFVEIKAEEPIIPFFLFKGRLFSSSQILAFLYGATFIILITYLPIYIQSVYGASAMGAGLVLMPLLLGVVAGSASGGIFLTKTSYRNLMILSVITYFVGMLLLSTLGPESSRTLLTIYMVIVGYGMGFSFSLLPTASLHNLEPQYRGTANSTNQFMRTLGMTIGVTIFGSIQSKLLTSNLTEGFKDVSEGAAPEAFSNTDDLSQIFEPAVREKIPADILDIIVSAMSNSITHIYLLALIPIGIAFLFVYLMGSARELGIDSEDTK